MRTLQAKEQTLSRTLESTRMKYHGLINNVFLLESFARSHEMHPATKEDLWQSV